MRVTQLLAPFACAALAMPACRGQIAIGGLPDEGDGSLANMAPGTSGQAAPAANNAGASAGAPIGPPGAGDSTGSSTPAQDASASDAASVSAADSAAMVSGCGDSDSTTGGVGGEAGAPTWTELYTMYFADGTQGSCANVLCHFQMNGPAASYQWLLTQPQCSPAGSPPLACLTCYGGGNMPKFCPFTQQACKDVAAWAAAGAQNN